MVAASLFLIVGTACSGVDAPTAAPGPEAPTETLAPFVIDESGVTGSCDAATGADPSGDGAPAAAGSPLGAPGARQLPGPSATVTTVPTSATSIVMRTPTNPDEASPARQPDAVGTPTEPYVIGGSAEAEGSPSTTADPEPAEPTGPATACEGGL